MGEGLGTAGGRPAEFTGAKRRSGRGLRILLAEDNEVNQKVATRWLEKAGHHVEVRTNGHEALAALENGLFDVVLMDVQMPGLDGLAAAAEIRRREHSGGRRVPIVALTAHAMRGDRERCLEAGMDAYLSKPVQSGELLDTIERIAALGTEGGWNGAAVSGEAPMAFRQQLACLDRALALDRVGGDLGLLQEIARLYLEEAPRLISEIRAAIAARDAAALERAAHSLKGATGNFTSEAPFKAALELEMLARKGSLDSAPDRAARLERHFEQLKNELTALCTESAGPA